MYVRQHDSNRQGIKIPDNYSGHAFREPSIYSDMPPPAKIDRPPTDRYETQPLSQNSPTEAEDTFDVAEESLNSLPSAIPTEEKATRHTDSIFASLLPRGIASSDHFPFGHGLGSEELLILDMMLLVFLSEKEGEESDRELILLLGLLLFAG